MPIADTLEDEFFNDVSGNYVAYTLSRFDDDDIYVYNISSGERKQITDPENNELAMRRHPAVSGNHVVWQDDRDGSFDIYLYDLVTETETLVSTTEIGLPIPGDQVHPAIHENLVVWEDRRDPSNDDIYVCDISIPDPAPVLIPADEAHGETYLQAYPDVYGRYVVFDEASPADLGNRDVVLWSLDSNAVVWRTTSAARQERSRIDGTRVVWEDSRTGNIDIYTYNIETEQVDPVTTDPNMQFLCDISGNRIVWTDLRNISQEYPGNYDIYMFTVEEEPPPPPEPDISVSPTTLSFGEVEVGQTSVLIATISNLGDAPLELTVELCEPGPQWWDFAWTPTSATVDPGAVVDLVVTFSPSGGVSISGAVIISNDPDEPYVYLTFTGFGVMVPVPPSQLFQDLLEFYDANCESGNLQGVAPTEEAAENLEAIVIRNKIILAYNDYINGDIEEACEKLHIIYERIDGVTPPSDFIVGNPEVMEEFRQRVLDLLEAIGCSCCG